MKVTFNLDSGANINSCRSITFDLSKNSDQKAFGYTEEEWKALTEDEKYEVCEEWAEQRVEIYFEEEE